MGPDFFDIEDAEPAADLQAVSHAVIRPDGHMLTFCTKIRLNAARPITKRLERDRNFD